ncbi:SUKH-4 immunity protein of toxin-antitoxin system [Nocardiopsis sp. Huas11]|uniref:SUKH-4 family immunity protein n=1 Tax=Nocardiopsis sp. Huas11 TaxID=2183912 RepID=UPI000F13B23A|nr:SUKH-4 family immunity protein [Nocardiopsis sp. Huas11]RKS05969.1 SUKH-4 immunity protein of toxin-antitoxin system [Nocardiopsis sp. Huas11]
MNDPDEPLPSFLWTIGTADPQLLVTASAAHACAVERWEVCDFDRTVLDLYRTRMDPWHARHLWAVTGPVRDLASGEDRVHVPGTDAWDVPESGRRALRTCGLPASLFHHGYESSSTPRWGPGPRHLDFHLLAGDQGGRPFRVERGTGRVANLSSDPNEEPLASSLVAFTEIAWRRYHLARLLTEEGLDSGWVGGERELVTADFADLVRWIDPESRFPEIFPLIDDL